MSDPIAIALFAATLLGLALVSLVLDRDLWPFAPYSMFSRRHDPAEIHVFRLALVDRDGRRAFWAPHYRYESRYFSGRVAALVSDPQLDASARREALLALVLATFAYALREDASLDGGSVRELLLVHRSVTPGRERGAESFSVRDVTVLRLPMVAEMGGDP